MEGHDQWILAQSSLRIAVRTFTPLTSGSHPVIFATRLGTVKENRTSAFVNAFSDTAYASIIFDYTTWASSEALPRHTVEPQQLYEDMRSVIAWARKQSAAYDPARIIALGSRFGGMPVARLLAEDHGIAAGISQWPCMDASAASRTKPITTTLHLGALPILDALGSLVGCDPIYVAAAANMEGDDYSGPALMNAHDVPGYSKVVGFATTPLKNRVTTRSALHFPLARPGSKASQIVAPCLVVLPEFDAVALREAAITVSKNAEHRELFIINGEHSNL